jgi:nitroreductase
VNRRSFVASTLLCAASACLPANAANAAAPAWPSGPAHVPATPPPPNLAPWLESLLSDAARAPSSHNSQPWTLTLVSEKRWALAIERSRRLATVDPQDREAWISLGAFCAALETSAAARGLRADLAGLDSAGDTAVIALSARAPDSDWLASLRARRCLRRNLRAVAVPPQLWQAAQARSPMACRFFAFPSDEARLIAARTVEAEIVQQGMDAVWQELADWIRWSPAAERKTPSGLTPAGMELPLPVRLWVAAAYDRGDVVGVDFRLHSLQSCRRRVEEGAGWLVIATPTDDRSAWLEAGRALQRVWLTATRLGLALHPMSQALEAPSLREQLTRQLGLGQPQLLLRVGKPSRLLAPVSPRLAPTQFARLQLQQEGAA